MATAQDDGIDWDAVGFITSSDYRTRVISALADGPGTPTSLADRTELEVTHVSRSLSSLREHDLVELLVAEDTHKGRIYGLTDEGGDIVEKALEVDA